MIDRHMNSGRGRLGGYADRLIRTVRTLLLGLLCACFLAPTLTFARPAVVASEQALVTQVIRYDLPAAGEVFLVWGVNDWALVPEATRPPDTVVKDDVMHTPMARVDDTFVVTLKVPAGAMVDYAFQITKTRNGTPIDVWDANGASEANYHTPSSPDGVAEVQASVALPESTISVVFDLRKHWAALLIFLIGLGAVLCVNVLPLGRRALVGAEASRAYTERIGERDLRIDFLRGLALISVIVDHIYIGSYFSFLSLERIGVVTGAEGFVVLSGFVNGMIHRSRIERYGWSNSASKLIDRAITLYLASVCVIASVYMLKFVPFIDSQILTTYKDEVSGIVYDLYQNDGGFTQLVANILLLNYGPGQFNVIGLFAELSVLSPLFLWLIMKGRVKLLLALSWIIYIVHSAYHITVLPTQSENAFPMLSWQVLFVNALVVGYYRKQIFAFMQSKYGKLIFATSSLLFLGFMFYTLTNPWIDVPNSAKLPIMSEDAFNWIYERFFLRDTLGIGRIINEAVILVVLYGILTRYWSVLNRMAGWFLVPLGQASLYAFIVHVFFVLVIDNIPLFHTHNVLISTAGHAIVLMTIWMMVRTKFLFRWIPR